MKLYKKILLKQNYLFHRNLQFEKFIKISPSASPGCGTIAKLTHMPPANLFPNHHTVVGETPHNTLANSNLHQPLICFHYMIPSCKQY